MGRRSENMEVESVIGKETQFKGTLKGEGSIRIEGKVDGKIGVEGDVSTEADERNGETRFSHGVRRSKNLVRLRHKLTAARKTIDLVCE